MTATKTPGNPRRIVKKKTHVPLPYTLGYRKGMKSVAQKKKNGGKQ